MDNSTMSCSTNICQNNGKCFLLANHTTTTVYCLCNGCFTGNQCEIERYSKNLWIYGMSEENGKTYNLYVGIIIPGIFGIISFVSNLLSLQTFLFSKKIRITNLGIYLILFSLIALIISIIQSVFAFMNLASNFKMSEVCYLIQCAFINILLVSLNYSIYWFSLYIAVERFLIAYSFVSLYSSRRRSVISSILLYILLLLANLLPILFGRKGYSYNSYDFCLLNFTSAGYIFYSMLDYINDIAALLAFIITSVFIFKRLIEHRLSLVNDESFRSSLGLIASRHYDFFLPPLVYSILIIPFFIFNKLMTCLGADSTAVLYTAVITYLFANSAFALTFFLYVYLSKIYLTEFWQTSPFGRFLLYVKERFINCYKHQITVVDSEC